MRATDGDAAELADSLSPYLRVDDTDLDGLVACLERVLAVLSLGITAVRTLATHLALKQGDAPEAVHAITEILTAWRKADVACRGPRRTSGSQSSFPMTESLLDKVPKTPRTPRLCQPGYFDRPANHQLSRSEALCLAAARHRAGTFGKTAGSSRR